LGIKINKGEIKMKKNTLLINSGLIFLLLFCLAFACGDGGDETGGGDRTDTTSGLPAGKYACATTVPITPDKAAAAVRLIRFTISRGKPEIRLT